MRKFLLLFALLSSPVLAQPWAGILAPNRAIDWSSAGVSGGIPARETICATFNPGATAAAINTQLAACPAGQTVKLNAGTYNLTAGLQVVNKSNVTLRGAGPNQTFLVFTGSGSGCVLGNALICVYQDSTNPTGQNSANWTAGYTKGLTTVTLSSVTNLAVGRLLMLDQLNDSNTDNGQLWMCEAGGVCATEGPSGFGRSGRTQGQAVVVTAIAGNQVSFTPALFMPNWRSSQSPGAWWFNAGVVGVGIEDLSVDNTNSTSFFNIEFGGVRDSWVKNVRSLRSNRAHILGYVTSRITVRDSYFYGTLNALSQSYGSETNMSSSWLFENNIYEHITGPMQPGQQNGGTVFGHNFSLDDFYTNPNWMQASAYTHTAGINYTLFEGNDGLALTADAIHGTAHFVTSFRNNWPGWETGKSDQTVPFHNYAFNRYFNVVGNILGRGGYHTAYQCAASGTTGGCATQNVSIYVMGYSGNQQQFTGINNDPLIDDFLLRWGNFDTVNNGVRFVSAEIPSGIASYPNPVPASQTLPASFYLAGQPSWWATAFGTPPWPAIGPEVTGGPVTSGTNNLGGRVHKNPARRCWENSALHGANPYKLFSATACYTAASTPLPNPPTDIILTDLR